MGSQPTVHVSGTRCRSCQRVTVPRQNFGCEQCGAHGDDLVDETLSGNGRVLESLSVRAHPQKLPTPFVIAKVHLDEGPVIHARLLDVPTDTPSVRGLAGREVVAQRCELEGPDLAFVLKEATS